MGEVISRIKEEIAITDYAQRMGFTLVRKGRYYSLKEHDSVIIDTSKNCFWRNSVPGKGKAIGVGGSIIDFVMEFEGKSLGETISLLRDEISQARPGNANGGYIPIAKKGGLQLPEKGRDMHKVFAYLIQTRKIAKNIVQEMVERKQLYQDNYGNCVFVSYDEKGVPDFATRRGTNTYKSFYGDVAGCNYEKCFYVNNKAKKLYITEAVIDALSVMTLLPLYQTYNYLALTGAGKWNAILSYLSNRVLEEIWIGTDDDEAGRKAGTLIEENVKRIRPDIKVEFDYPSRGKDWNEFLKRSVGQ